MNIDSKTKGRLMAGHPLEVDNILRLPPKTVGDILFVGEEEYSKRISLLSITKADLIKDSDKLDRVENLTDFNIITNNCYYSIEFREEILGYLEFFFDDSVNFLENIQEFYIGEIEDGKRLTNNNYQEFLNCLILQNKIDNTKIRKKPKKKMSAKKRRLLEKREKGRKLMEKVKGQDNILLSDLALNLSVFLGGDFERVNNLTLYQFYELYSKFLRRDRYGQNFDIYIAGGDPKKLDLDNHWTAKEVQVVEEKPQSIV